MLQRLQVNRKVKWRRNRLAQGFCWDNCGRFVVPGETRCVGCRETHLERERKRAKARQRSAA